MSQAIHYYGPDETQRRWQGFVGAALSNTQVDLNPHQIKAALFARHNPYSRGALLVDEGGLGKTIEAGLLLAQQWAEHKRWETFSVHEIQFGQG